ncbi:MAG: hypothetical protein GY856_07120 [bacterium]|nr:hypothetical protein [bacterium]
MSADISTAEGHAFLEVAESIGDRICRQAQWSDESGEGECTWEVPDVRPPDRGMTTTEAGPFLYSGTAGIGLYLLHLYRNTEKAEHLETARGALAWALERAKQGQAIAGYYSGTAGVAAVCAEMARVDGSRPWLEEARALGEMFAAGVASPGLFDLISGEAGSILGLLRIYEATRAAGMLDAARRLGDHLLENSRREPDGISWDVLHPGVFRNLVGLSHGAGGIGVALLELYRWTGETRYLVAAIQALHYEDSFADVAGGSPEGGQMGRSWPDLRNRSVGLYLETGREEELTRELLAGRFVSESSEMMLAWCHGPPGIALVRSRFLAVTGLDRFGPGLASAAARTYEAVTGGPPANHSLCHGLCGNADVLLELHRQHPEPRYFEAALSAARRGLDEVHRTDGCWLSGFEGRLPTPSLMLGEAGIGLFYLRLIDPEIPSCLLPVPQAPPQEPEYDEELIDRAVRAGYFAHFPRTERALRAAGIDPVEVPLRGNPPFVPLRGNHREFLDGLGATVGSASSVAGEAVAARLRDALALESMAFELLCERDDFSQRHLRSLVQPDPGLLDHPDTLVRLAPGARLFRAGTNWEPLLAGEVRLEDLDQRPACYLLYEADLTTRILLLEGLAAEMYALLREPIRVGTLVERMIAHLVAGGMLAAPDDGDAEAVREKLRTTLRKAYTSEMIEIADPYPLEPADIGSDLCIRCGECCRIQVQVQGDAVYAEFLREMLEQPLKSTYPEACVAAADAPGTAYVAVDLGPCRHLRTGTTEDGEASFTCRLYEDRPETCREFNCVVWWRRQRRTAIGPTKADAIIEKVAKLMGLERADRTRTTPHPSC